MENRKATKRALLTSITALAMCVVMLVGTTFAWFTDTASTNVNKIEAGNLDVVLQMEDGTGWKDAEGETLQFKKAGSTNQDLLWEPGCTYELPKLRVVNNGNLKLKYKVAITGINGDAKLNKAIDWTINNDGNLIDATATVKEYKLDAKNGATVDSDILTITGHMKENAGNEYQGLTIDGIAITVTATQATGEYDSTRNDYDENADYTIQVNKDNIQDYLDGKYGSIDGMTLVLADGEYDTLELGRATKYPGSHTETYLLKSGDVLDAKTIDEIKETIAANPGGGYGTPCYIRSMSNVTFKAAVGAQVSVAGVYAFSGHRYQDGYDYVLDRDVVTGTNTYYVANRLTNITFDGITFTANSDIETSQKQAIINGFTFKNCIFNIGNTTDNSDYIALRYYNENNNGNVRNLVVDNCKFNNCRQGVYTSHVYGVSVTNSTFNTTGHNAIAVQAHGGNLCNHGKVVITDNVFNGIGDRIIRFNNVGADTQITIKRNIATNSGNTGNEVIRATSLADGIKYDISDNNWGDGKTVANPEFADKISN